MTSLAMEAIDQMHGAGTEFFFDEVAAEHAVMFFRAVSAAHEGAMGRAAL